jgi:hypothetical protein
MSQPDQIALKQGEWGRITFGSYIGELCQVQVADRRDLLSRVRLKGTDIIVLVPWYDLEPVETPKEVQDAT